MTTQHGTDTPGGSRPLPELHEGELDAEGLAALFRDIEALTDLREVIVKGGAEVRAASRGTELALAHDRLRTRQVRAVQLRYLHQGAEWWDTVMALPTGFRVVRIRQDWSTRD